MYKTRRIFAALQHQPIQRRGKKMHNLSFLWEVKMRDGTLRPSMICLQIVEGYARVRLALGLYSNCRPVATTEPYSAK